MGAFGVSLALLFNTKYSAYLYACALLVALLLDHRRLLTKRWMWIGGLMGALGLLPVVAWNAVHGWASFRWQLSHLAVNPIEQTQGLSLLGNVRHSLAYLSWPLVTLALVGVGRLRSPAERLLSLVALFSILPLALSPANSPRNLSSGLVPLLLLAGARWPSTLRSRRRQMAAGLLAAGVAATAVYGVGTVATLFGPYPWPHSSVVPSIRRDAAGWRELGPVLAAHPAPVFALDYSIASQIWYYTARPAYTAWGQYRVWGIPAFHDVTIIGLDYLPEAPVSARLREAFEHVEGPQRFLYSERGATKEIRVWQAEGLQWDQATFLQRFDFLTLLEASR